MSDMQLDPNKRYLLSRPRGGFNDVMVQIEKSRLYAAEHDRVLVLDTTRSGLREPFGDVFDVKDNFGCDVLTLTDDLATALDAATSVRPAMLRHRIKDAEPKFMAKYRCFMDLEHNLPTGFDHSIDHPEQVLVYEQAGGGCASISLLERVTLKPEIAREILHRFSNLTEDFDAVHIRHSDYKTRFRTFLRRMRPLLKDRSVLVCSDSVAAIKAAEDILDDSTTVLCVSNVPDLGGQPLHSARISDFRAATLDLLSDLLAMSFARNLYFTHVGRRMKVRALMSGYSLLAEVLRHNPDVVDSLLSAGGAPVKRAARPAERMTKRRRFQMQVYRLWNFRALRIKTKINEEARARAFSTAKMGPNIECWDKPPDGRRTRR